MDTTDPDIQFDKLGISNHWYSAQKAIKEMPVNQENSSNLLANTLTKIKESGKGKPFDCITGISGGVDSTYVAYLAKQYGLRPLVVHFDNGWNSELAVKNIENIVNHLGFELYTLVVDWVEFRELQKAYLKASVIDIEVPTDHAITGTLFRLAAKHNIKYILSGNNVVTEHIMPRAWIYQKNDAKNLLDINKKFGTKPLKSYPVFGMFDYIKYQNIYKIETLKLLNYIDFNKNEAKEIIKEKLDWRDYGGKHYESLFTKFYQAYILPEKFNVDKRKAHLSSLICSDQLTKEIALKELNEPLYNDRELKNDKEYVLKKFGFNQNQFDEIMHASPRSHNEFKSDLAQKKRYMDLLKKTASIRSIFKS